MARETVVGPIGRRGSARNAQHRARKRVVRILLGAAIIGALVAANPGIAAAVPPPPPNPSDSDIASAGSQVNQQLGQVGVLINQVASANEQLQELTNQVL